MSKITSVQNPLVKAAAALREPKHRRAQGLTIINGTREIERAFQAGVRLEKVFFVAGRHPDWLKGLYGKGVELVEVSEGVLNKLAYGERNEGIVAVAQTVVWKLRDLQLSGQPLVVVLEAVEKPGNLGAILRTCDAVGADAVLVCDPKTDIDNPNVIRSSTGAVFTVPVVCAPPEEILAFLQEQKIKIYTTSPAAKKFYTEVSLKGGLAVILGSEDGGLSSFWLKAAEISVRVPMKGFVDSLNVSTTAAIVLYEALRQRN